MSNTGHIQKEEAIELFDSLIERYPWTRRYYNYSGKPFEEKHGWFDSRLAMGDFPGWARIFEKVCAEIQDVLDKHDIPAEQFVIEQVKEKFARIRLYWGFYEIGEDGFPASEIGKSGFVIDFMGSGSLSGVGGQSAEDAGYDRKYDLARVEIREVLKRASDESYATCMFCGSTEDVEYTTGWVMPACKKCQEAGIVNRRTYCHEILGDDWLRNAMRSEHVE